MRADHTPHLMLVEDDQRLAELVLEYLRGQGFVVTHEARGDTALARILAEQPDLVILDLMLPGLDGLSVCRQLRPRYTGGVIMLTARGDEVDEVVGLEIGADDYLAKPVRPRLLLAHIHSVLRRLEQPRAVGGPTADRIALGGLIVDASARRADLDGRAVNLTGAEFDLLWLLARHAGEPVSRETIYQALRGIEYDGLDRAMDLRVARLRRKLGDDAHAPRRLKSVRGVGYLLVADP